MYKSADEIFFYREAFGHLLIIVSHLAGDICWPQGILIEICVFP